MPRPTEPPLEKPPDHPIVLFQAADGQVCLDVRLQAVPPARVNRSICEAMTVSSSHSLLTSADVVALLQRHFDHLAKEFHVASLDLFGSYAHGEQTPESDVDLLVSFSQPVGFGFIHLAERLETLLGKPVDLLAADGINPNRRDAILSSVIHVAP